VECKSYLDSYGVAFSSFAGGNGPPRYKLFTEDKLRTVVLKRLITQLIMTGACRPSPRVMLCLAAGKIRSEIDRRNLKQHFKKKRWLLWDDEWIGTALREMSKDSYENDVGSLVAKLLVRGMLRNSPQ